MIVSTLCKYYKSETVKAASHEIYQNFFGETLFAENEVSGCNMKSSFHGRLSF